MKHHETLEHSSFDATILALDAETLALDVETSAFGAATSAIPRRSFDVTISPLDVDTSALDEETSAIARSYRRYRGGVSGNIGDCGVGITPQMYNRVTEHGDISTFSKPAAVLLPIPVALSLIPAVLLLISAPLLRALRRLVVADAAIGDGTGADADRCVTH